MDNFFRSILNDTAQVIEMADFIICLATALAIGVVVALAYMFKTRYTKSFVVTLALLPAVVCVVIMMVNENIGIGVAVAGAFSLVRFRSVPGTAKEIGTIFLAMTSGLICGTGYLGYAIAFTLILCAIFMLYSALDFGAGKRINLYKSVRITISEDLDYTEAFEPVLKKYCGQYELVAVKTVNMGSLFKLTYDVILKDTAKEKAMIDDLRCRNGNLEITVSKQTTEKIEL